ncbi:switch-associated protein 70-like isoform X2 [Anneissia japonica]|uniref:switch-associated protein 70-like isoform X2 n=1 Tax=Anneissia japonica TaxID=1529436 RepID=UPI00142560ED|nr:switch-associated protein 70-like isoform X2 [Anneissia japonica]
MTEKTKERKRSVCTWLWHVFDALDENKNGLVDKQQLRIITAHIGNSLGVNNSSLVANKLAEYFKDSPESINFTDYYTFISNQKFIEADMMDMKKIENVCWMICSKKFNGREGERFNLDDVYKLWQVFNILVEPEVLPISIDREEFEILLEKLVTAMGKKWNTSKFEVTYKDKQYVKFIELLKSLECEYGMGMDEMMLRMAVKDVHDECVMEVEKKGMMKKKGHMIASWKDRWFVLSQETLTYYTDRSEKEAKGQITLTPFWKVELINDGKYKNMFVIYKEGKSTNEKSRYEMSVSDLRTRQEWITALTLVLRRLQNEESSMVLKGAKERQEVRTKIRKEQEEAEEKQRMKDEELELMKKRVLESEREAQEEAEKRRKMEEEEAAMREKMLREKQILEEQMSALLTEHEKTMLQAEAAAEARRKREEEEEQRRQQDVEELKKREAELNDMKMAIKEAERRAKEEAEKRQLKELEEEEKQSILREEKERQAQELARIRMEREEAEEKLLQEQELWRQKEEEEDRKTQEYLEELKRKEELLSKVRLDMEDAEKRALIEEQLKLDEQRRREELETLNKELEELLQEERQAKRDEEIVRALQARLLEEESEKREELEKLKEQQERMLQEERERRENLEQRSEELETQRLEQARILEEERTKLNDLEQKRIEADNRLLDAMAKLTAAEKESEEKRRKRAELNKPIGLARPIQPSAKPLTCHRGPGVFTHGHLDAIKDLYNKQKVLLNQNC